MEFQSEANISHLLKTDGNNEDNIVEFSEYSQERDTRSEDERSRQQQRRNRYISQQEKGNTEEFRLEEDLVDRSNKESTERGKKEETNRQEREDLRNWELGNRTQSVSELASESILRNRNSDRSNAPQRTPSQISETNTNQPSDRQSDTGAQIGGSDLEKYEKDFYDVYNKAREYRRRVVDLENRMLGGQSSTGDSKPKKKLNATMKRMIDMVGELKNNFAGANPDIKHVEWMSVAKLIIDDARDILAMVRKISNPKDIPIDDPELKREINDRVARATEFISKFRTMPKKKKEARSNRRNKRNLRSRRKRQTGGTDDTGSLEDEWTKKQQSDSESLQKYSGDAFPNISDQPSVLSNRSLVSDKNRMEEISEKLSSDKFNLSDKSTTRRRGKYGNNFY